MYDSHRLIWLRNNSVVFEPKPVHMLQLAVDLEISPLACENCLWLDLDNSNIATLEILVMKFICCSTTALIIIHTHTHHVLTDLMVLHLYWSAYSIERWTLVPVWYYPGRSLAFPGSSLPLKPSHFPGPILSHFHSALLAHLAPSCQTQTLMRWSRTIPAVMRQAPYPTVSGRSPPGYFPSVADCSWSCQSLGNSHLVVCVENSIPVPTTIRIVNCRGIAWVGLKF